jgi:D-glycero-D-manno-heptose 1,7-bisphosphate phosphatase
MTARAAVFLDRDGVLNEPVLVDGRPHPPETVDDLVVHAGTEGACRALKRAGALLIVVTNQPDIARGTCDRETVDAINDALRRRLHLDDVLVCPHDDADGCACRKPGIGLFEEASRRWRVDLTASVMVGDRWRDIEAGRAAGCATVWIDRHYDERPAVGADLTVRTLSEAVPWIVSRGIGGSGNTDETAV